MIRLIIKKIFYKELTSVRDELRQEIADMQTTVNSLRDEVTKIDKTMGSSSEILTTMGMGDSSVPWWKDNKILYSKDTDPQTRLLAYKIESSKEREYALAHPSLKKRAIYHGGCLGCKRPTTQGLGSCKGCQYFECDWNLPSKFMK